MGRRRSCKAEDAGDDDGQEEDPCAGDPIPSVLDGYNQTYIVRSGEGPLRDVMFRCGNWCYSGEVSFAGLGDRITLKDVPKAIPMLQRQQGRLAFYCCASAVPPLSPYASALDTMADAADFVAAELCGDAATAELEKWSKVFPWIDEEVGAPANGAKGAPPPSTYFELKADVAEAMAGVSLVASKTYTRGLVFIVIYFEGSFYVVMQVSDADRFAAGTRINMKSISAKES